MGGDNWGKDYQEMCGRNRSGKDNPRGLQMAYVVTQRGGGDCSKSAYGGILAEAPSSRGWAGGGRSDGGNLTNVVH